MERTRWRRLFDLAYPDVRIGIEFDRATATIPDRGPTGTTRVCHNRATAQGWLLFHMTAGADVGPVVLAYRSRTAA